MIFFCRRAPHTTRVTRVPVEIYKVRCLQCTANCKLYYNYVKMFRSKTQNMKCSQATLSLRQINYLVLYTSIKNSKVIFF